MEPADTHYPDSDSAFRPGAIADLYGALDSLEDAIFVLDCEGNILFRNYPASCLVDTGTHPGTESLTMLPKVEPWECVRRLLKAAARGQIHTSRKAWEETSGKCWLVSLRETRPERRPHRRLVLLLKDVTAAETLQQSRQHDDAMARSGTLLAGAAHQAKNILFDFSATLEAFRAVHAMQLSEADPLLHNLDESVVRMAAMVQNLLENSRSAAPSGHAFAAAAAVARAVGACRNLAATRSVEIDSQIRANATLRGELTAMVRALENVIDNAIRYAPPGSQVIVRLERQTGRPARLCCTVIDRGPGFPEAEIEQVFTPFFTRRAGGTGLGLTVARKIIEDHGGAITAANAPEGGAIVAIVLPLNSSRNRMTEPALYASCGVEK